MAEKDQYSAKQWELIFGKFEMLYLLQINITQYNYTKTCCKYVMCDALFQPPQQLFTDKSQSQHVLKIKFFQLGILAGWLCKTLKLHRLLWRPLQFWWTLRTAKARTRGTSRSQVERDYKVFLQIQPQMVFCIILFFLALSETVFRTINGQLCLK